MITLPNSLPQGGGVVSLNVAPLAAGACLPPLQLTQRGQVESVSIEAIAFGRIDVPVAQRMAAAAEQALKKVRRMWEACSCSRLTHAARP